MSAGFPSSLTPNWRDEPRRIDNRFGFVLIAIGAALSVALDLTRWVVDRRRPELLVLVLMLLAFLEARAISRQGSMGRRFVRDVLLIAASVFAAASLILWVRVAHII